MAVRELSTVFFFSIYGLVCLSSVMLALAEGAAIPAGLSIPIALTAYFFSERWKLLRLSPAMANLAGVLAFMLAGSELLGPNIEARLLSGAHLLVYLSWIVLFQRKEARHYWWMCALGLLQVAVGSVLTKAGIYGALLIGYVLLAIWTLSVFSLYQARRRFALREPSAADVHDGVLSLNPFGSTAAAVNLGALLRRTSVVRGSMQRDQRERPISLRFALGTFGVACTAMAISACFFLLIPRVWIGKRAFRHDPTSSLQQPLTGFTEEVQLGDLGQILESTERVLEVRLFDQQTDQQIDVEKYAAELGYEEPLFRGSVLGFYNDGRWATIRSRAAELYAPGNSPGGLVRQEIRLRPIGTEILFAIHPVYGAEAEAIVGPLRIRLADAVLLRPDQASAKQRFSYTVYSPLPIPDRSTQWPATSGPPWFSRRHIADYRTLPTAGLERLAVLAREVSGVEAATRKPSAMEVARRLEAHLRDSGEYAYSLDLSIQDPTIDPVEDFLFNRKAGHCEYYASALALMLRAVGIPARLISGFKGGVTNRFSGYFVVEQRHAHAWVEALIDGNWIVLDATPVAGRSESIASMTPRLRTWHDLRGFVSELWNHYVLGMNLPQQRTEFYGPLKDLASDCWESISSSAERLVTSADALKDILASPKRWFSWHGGVVTFVLLLLVLLLVWVARHSGAFWGRSWSLIHKRGGGKRIQVEFYERFRRICQRRALVREASQTQREFAYDVHRSLGELLASCGLSELPFEVVELFYRVRFGAEQLGPDRTAEVHRHLTKLEQALLGKGPRRASSGHGPPD